MNEYIKLIKEILFQPRAFQSDYCRYNAYLVAEAASRGHISCVVQGERKNRWYVTKKGLGFLRHHNIEV